MKRLALAAVFGLMSISSYASLDAGVQYKESVGICTDVQNESTIRVEHDTRTPDVLYVDDFKYVYSTDVTVGDVNTVTFTDGKTSVQIQYILDGEEVTEVQVRILGKVPGSKFVSGSCE